MPSSQPSQTPNGGSGSSFSPLLISAGETNLEFNYIDSDGDIWLPDEHFGGGATSFTSKSIIRTQDDILFQKQRYGIGMVYSIPVPPGEYKVTLYMTEMSLKFFGIASIRYPHGGIRYSREFGYGCFVRANAVCRYLSRRT